MRKVIDCFQEHNPLINKKLKNVFLEPDRTVEERRQHRKLITQMKESALETPGYYFFIKNGKVCSEQKKPVAIDPSTPRGPRSPTEAIVMKLKAAGKPIPPELRLKMKQRNLLQDSAPSSEESGSD